jgi:hypothetical protein
MSMAAVFLDIEKTFDTMWHSGLLYKLSELEFSTSLIKLIAFFLTDKVLVEGEFSVSRKIQAGVAQGSVLTPLFYSLYINDALAAPGTDLALFVYDTFIYLTEKHECCVLCKLQQGLTAVNLWCECWNLKINEGKIRQSISPEDVSP